MNGSGETGQFLAGDCASSGRHNRVTEGWLRVVAPVDDPVDVPNVLADHLSQAGLGHADAFEVLSEIAHAPYDRAISATTLQKVKIVDDVQIATAAHNVRMPFYRYRDNFDRHYRAFRDRSGWSAQQVADHLGKTVSMINTYRRKGEHGSVPPQDVCIKASKLFECSIFELMDDAGLLAEAPGVDVSKLTPIQRFQYGKVIKPLFNSTLTDEERDILIDELNTRIRLFENLKKK